VNRDRLPAGPKLLSEGRSRDLLSPQRRSWNMSRIRGKDTTSERVVCFIAPKLIA
jgi:hypothetical protein